MLLTVCGVVAKFTKVNSYHLMADPNEIGGFPFYYGIVSNLGILLLVAASSCCLFCRSIMHKDTTDKNWRNLLSFSGWWLLLLALDDLLQFHENLVNLVYGPPSQGKFHDAFSHYFFEALTFSFYGLLFLLIVLKYRKLIIQTPYQLLAFSIVHLGISLVIDFIWIKVAGRYFVEESFKFLGILLMAVYYFKVCQQTVRGNQQPIKTTLSKE